MEEQQAKEEPKICESCNDASKKVQKCRDPFLFEVHGKTIYRFYCKECYQRRQDDI